MTLAAKRGSWGEGLRQAGHPPRAVRGARAQGAAPCAPVRRHDLVAQPDPRQEPSANFGPSDIGRQTREATAAALPTPGSTL